MRIGSKWRSADGIPTELFRNYAYVGCVFWRKIGEKTWISLRKNVFICDNFLLKKILAGEFSDGGSSNWKFVC